MIGTGGNWVRNENDAYDFDVGKSTHNQILQDLTTYSTSTNDQCFTVDNLMLKWFLQYAGNLCCHFCTSLYFESQQSNWMDKNSCESHDLAYFGSLKFIWYRSKGINKWNRPILWSTQKRVFTYSCASEYSRIQWNVIPYCGGVRSVKSNPLSEIFEWNSSEKFLCSIQNLKIIFWKKLFHEIYQMKILWI